MTYLIVGLIVMILDKLITPSEDYKFKDALILGIFWPVMVIAVTIIIVCAILDNRDIVKKDEKDESETKDETDTTMQ